MSAGSTTDDGPQPAHKVEAEEPHTEKPSPTQSFPDGGARAWAVALGAGGVLFCTFGYVNAFGVYQEYYVSHQLSNHSASAISWIGSIQTFFLFAAGLVGGPLFDRYGGKVIWAPSLAVVISVMMTSLCKQYYQFFLAQGILGGVSLGLTMSPALSSTAQYFQKKRAAAMGITVAGSSLGGVIFPIALQKLLHSSLGFGWAVRIIGFIIFAVLAFCVASIRARLPPRKKEFLQLQAFKKPVFVATLVSVFLLNLGLFTPFFYLPLYGQSHNMSTQLSSYLISILNGSSFFGRLIPGILADKVGTLNMLAFVSLISGILALCWIRMTSSAAIIVFAVLYGFFSGGMISLTAASVANVPDTPRDIGTYIGMAMAFLSIATLIGPPISGALLDSADDFWRLQTFSGVVITIGAFGVMGTKLIAGKKLFGKG